MATPAPEVTKELFRRADVEIAKIDRTQPPTSPEEQGEIPLELVSLGRSVEDVAIAQMQGESTELSRMGIDLFIFRLLERIKNLEAEVADLKAGK